MIVYADAQGKKEAARLICPRQPNGDFLALSDYFASVESGQLDTVALQVVTVGKAATALFEELQAANDYTEAYFLHGLAVQAAEATADYILQRCRVVREQPSGHRQSQR